ncbi:hypothetical protein NMG60_11034313 [Bertholletia excelsa]
MADIASISPVPLEAFWLEINERPLKRPLLDFEKLSISDSSGKAKGLTSKKVFVQHVETVSSSEATVDILQSILPKSVEGCETNVKNEERRYTSRTETKQNQLLIKAKKKQEALAKSARFEQIWRSRKGKKEGMHDNVLHEMCHVYDVIRVDAGERTNEQHNQEDTDLEDHRIMSSYLPLLREFIPSAAAEIESDIHDYISKQASRDEYVFDLYAVSNDHGMTEEDPANPFPLVKVDEDDEFYDGPMTSDGESDDSNAEDNPLNDYPDEETSEGDDDGGSKSPSDASEKLDSEDGKSSEPEDLDNQNWSQDAGRLYKDYLYDDNDACYEDYMYGDDEAYYEDYMSGDDEAYYD